MSEEEDSSLLRNYSRSFADNKKRNIIIISIVFFVIILVIAISLGVSLSSKQQPSGLSNDPLTKAKQLQSKYPMIDGHNDLPYRFRDLLKNKITQVNLRQLQDPNSYNTDIPRLRQGYVGAQFWSVYTPCSAAQKDAVRMTLEQIDVVNRMVQLYPDVFQLAYSVNDINTAFKNNKIASLIGMEGGHSIDSSLAALREFYAAGARYMTLTHNCNTPWAESCCDTPLTPTGLTPFGEKVILEMNRLGMLVDISHVSARTMVTVLNVSKAPVIFSHSCVYSICNISRNVPDNVLEMLPRNGGVVMINFFKVFINCTSDIVDINQVVNHIDYIVKKIGVDYVGYGSDFDGVGNNLPTGLEDVSKFIDLTAALISRGYSDDDIIKIIGGNLLRVFSQAEVVAQQLQTMGPLEDLIDYDFSNDTCRSPN